MFAVIIKGYFYVDGLCFRNLFDAADHFGCGVDDIEILDLDDDSFDGVQLAVVNYI